MIKINNSNVDLVVQCEEYTSVDNIFKLLTLDVSEILIICPNLFLQRFIQFNQEDFPIDVINEIEAELSVNNSFVSMSMRYKKKSFIFHFILTETYKKTINHPFKGEQDFNIGFKEIKI